MEHKNTYYEIIEMFPKKLESKLPIVSVFRIIIYYIVLFYLFIKDIISSKIKLRQLNKKIEVTEGREKNEHLDLSYLDKFSESESPIRTISKYYSIKDSKNKLKELEKIFEIDRNLFNNTFILKKREEIFNGKGKDNFYISVLSFKFIEKIKKYI